MYFWKKVKPFWLFSFFSFISLVFGWNFKSIFIENNNYRINNKNNPFWLYDVGLPNNSKPLSFIDLDNSRTFCIIYLKDDQKGIEIFQFSKNLKKYLLKFDIYLNLTIFDLKSIDFFNSGYNDLLITYFENENFLKLLILKNNKGLNFIKFENFNLNVSKIPFIFNDQINFYSKLLIQNLEFNNSIIYDPIKNIYLNSIPKFDFITSIQINLNENISYLTKNNNFLNIFDNNFNFINKFEIPNNSGNIYISDIDNDGNLDIIFPVFDEKPFLCILFNNGNGFFSDKTCSLLNYSLKIYNDYLSKNDFILQIEDINLNGRLDLLVSINNSSMQIYLNHICKNCGNRDIYFEKNQLISGYGGFFDLLDEGILGIITNKGTYLSNLTNNIFFLKVFNINGKCFDNCKNNNIKYPRPQYLSTFFSNSINRIIYSEKNGNKYQLVCNYNSNNYLSLPFCNFGLGKNIHFINELKLINSFIDKWTWIIPNSKIYLSNNHQIRIFNNFKIDSFQIVFWTISFLITLGFCVLYLSNKEEEEEKKEAQSILPLF